jgi:cardiolipin hydrolase
MHDKFAVIDESVVITGSFNWTTQAVRNNQENILFLENKSLAANYLSEFNKLWKEFGNVISVDEARKMMQNMNN